MKLEWNSDECSCTKPSSGGYKGIHTGPHIAESPWGYYTVEPYGRFGAPVSFRATFYCNCCETTNFLIEEVSFNEAYAKTREHFQSMFKRRML